MTEIVEKILSQKILGYSEDFTKTHIKHVVKIKGNDTSQVMYSTNVKTGSKGCINRGCLIKIMPYVARAIE